jgi:hypothetical protein
VNFCSLAGALLHIWPYITHVHWQSATSQPPLINPALFDARAPAAQGRTARAPTIAIESKKQTTDNRIPCSSAPHGGRISRTTRLLSTSELHYFGTRGRAEILPGVKVGGNVARRENIICRRTQKITRTSSSLMFWLRCAWLQEYCQEKPKWGKKRQRFCPRRINPCSILAADDHIANESESVCLSHSRPATGIDTLASRLLSTRHPNNYLSGRDVCHWRVISTLDIGPL